MIADRVNSSMKIEPDLLIIGASTRAAAFSAIRAGFSPLCADLFGDADLAARCPVLPVPAGGYEELVARLTGESNSLPWMYTGGLENRPGLVGALARKMPLWGNDASVLGRCRDPFFVADLLRAAGLPHPAVIRPEVEPPPGRWLLKPISGAGGGEIRFWEPGTTSHRPACAQEYVEGESRAAIFVGDGKRSRLLGVTRQLVGESWLHARPFRYCGSIGPVEPNPLLDRVGDVLVEGCGLRGLFGVDFIERDGVPWPVEVNPRYTASVEVLEYATGLRAISLHQAAALAGRALLPVRWTPDGQECPSCKEGVLLVGKAILFAPVDLAFPDNALWLADTAVDRMPGFADVPPSGQPIRRGQPVMSLFTSGDSVDACCQELHRIASDLDRQLFPGYKEDN